MQECDFLKSETDDIVISACPVLVEEYKTHNIWGYYLCIENQSEKPIRLVGKDWNITDDKGNSFHDETAGFKGEIPELEPGEFFEFTSTAPLSSANAVFYGSCKIVKDGAAKDIRIPTFTLAKESPVARVMN